MPTSNTHFVLLLGRVLRDNPRNANLEYALRASSRSRASHYNHVRNFPVSCEHEQGIPYMIALLHQISNISSP